MKKSFYVCDIETTGKSSFNAEMVEIYIGHYSSSKLIEDLHIFIKPRFWASDADDSVQFHGITKEKAMSGLDWIDAMKMIYDFLPNNPSHFVCHANRRMFGKSGCFDYQVLRSHFWYVNFAVYQYFEKIFPPNMIISTHSLSKKFLSNGKNDLKSVSAHLGIEIGNHHTAKNDAQVCWKIFKKLSKGLNIDEFCKNDYKPIKDEEVRTSKIINESIIFDLKG